MVEASDRVRTVVIGVVVVVPWRQLVLVLLQQQRGLRIALEEEAGIVRVRARHIGCCQPGHGRRWWNEAVRLWNTALEEVVQRARERQHWVLLGRMCCIQPGEEEERNLRSVEQQTASAGYLLGWREGTSC